jgi:hypothetical protein
VKASRICKGSGLFAAKRIQGNRFLGCYPGEACVDEMDEQEDIETVALFRIAAGKLYWTGLCHISGLILIDMSIHPPKKRSGIYFINHAREEEANAEFMYIETGRTRIVIAVAKRVIEPDEEIIASYSPKYTISTARLTTANMSRSDKHQSHHHDFDADFPSQPIHENQYRYIRGTIGSGENSETEEDEDSFERWVGKIISVRGREVQVQWLYRPEDIEDEGKRRGYKFKRGELLMTSTKSEREWHSVCHVERVVTVAEGYPSPHTELWWARYYFKDRELVTAPCKR